MIDREINTLIEREVAPSTFMSGALHNSLLTACGDAAIDIIVYLGLNPSNPGR
jgi:hypothetical protein